MSAPGRSAGGRLGIDRENHMPRKLYARCHRWLHSTTTPPSHKPQIKENSQLVLTPRAHGTKRCPLHALHVRKTCGHHALNPRRADDGAPPLRDVYKLSVGRAHERNPAKWEGHPSARMRIEELSSVPQSAVPNAYLAAISESEKTSSLGR